MNAKKMLIAAAAALIAVGATSAMAGAGTLGTSTEFGTVYTTITSWVDGDIGGIIAILMFAVGLGMGIMKQSLGAIVMGMGGALTAAYGVDVIEGIFGAGVPVVEVATSVVQSIPTL